MSKHKRQNPGKTTAPLSLGLTEADTAQVIDNKIVDSKGLDNLGASSDTGKSNWLAYIKNPSHWWVIGLVLLLTFGAFGAGLKYLEDSAKRQNAAGRQSATNNSQNESWLNNINPFLAPPTPTPTPQLSKEYIYAGSRMLAVEDANASAVPPADLAVWRVAKNGTATWYVMGGQSSQAATYNWGGTGDVPVPGDYDGDGKTDFSIFRPSTGVWHITRSSDSTATSYTFGQTGDRVAPADYDGDGKTDATVYRYNSTAGIATWYIQKSSDSTLMTQAFGLDTDVLAPADYDGDGKADIGIWRGSSYTFYVLRSSNGQLQYKTISAASSETASADYDGDGKADYALRNGTSWYIHYSTTNQTQTITWQAGDFAVENDYDGDGKVDIAVWRASNGNWYIRQSSRIGQTNELRQEAWGQEGDIPVPAFYRR